MWLGTAQCAWQPAYQRCAMAAALLCTLSAVVVMNCGDEIPRIKEAVTTKSGLISAGTGTLLSTQAASLKAIEEARTATRAVHHMLQHSEAATQIAELQAEKENKQLQHLLKESQIAMQAAADSAENQANEEASAGTQVQKHAQKIAKFKVNILRDASEAGCTLACSGGGTV